MDATTLSFQNIRFDVVLRAKQPWIPLSQLAIALYSNEGDSAGERGSLKETPFESRVRNIYRRHADEFTDKMTALVEMATAGGKQMVRIFSLRGAHLMAMFARTDVAKKFRKWALDILDREVEAQGAAPAQSDKHTRVPLKDAINMLVARSKHLNYSDAYKMVHQRFGIETVEEFSSDQVPLAVEYVHKLIAQWELVDQPALVALAPALDENMREFLQTMAADAEFISSWWKVYGKAIAILDPSAAVLMGEKMVGAAVGGRHLVAHFGLQSVREYAAAYPWSGDHVQRYEYDRQHVQVPA
ncbi:MAG: alpha/beta hydrolase [Pseudomonadota bacterium]